jgi:tripartite-type tricarboxylate transporter receptor subunit TctC
VAYDILIKNGTVIDSTASPARRADAGIARLALLLCLIALPRSAWAQYPTKPIHIVVPFPAGGVTDNVGRIIGQRLTEVVGQPIIFENKPGADGIIAASAVLQAPPDGYTLFLGTVTAMSAVPAVRKKPPFDPLADFSPISWLGSFTNLLLVHPSVPARTLAELIDYARANPGKLNYATTNMIQRIAAAQMMTSGAITMVHVPYKGSPQAIPDLVAGRVHVMFDSNVALGLAHVKEGKLRLLATMTDRRSSLAPQTPTLAEAGMPGVSVVAWAGLFGPAKMPTAITMLLSQEVNQVLLRPDVIKLLEAQGFEVKGSTPEQLNTLIARQLSEWRRMVNEGAIAQE